MDLRLRGKVAVVTGGSDGLGRAAIERLTAEGAAVATCARRADRLRAAAEDLRRGGGEILDVCLAQLAMKGRIVLCGAISVYNEKTRPPGPRNIYNLIVKRGRMEGFLVLDYLDRFLEGQVAMTGWLAEGRVKHSEHIVEGLERAPDALNLLFTGGNTGKVIVRL